MGGTVNKEAEESEAGEEENDEAKEEHEEESAGMPEPPPPGRMLLRGAFAGTLITSGHFLETSLPLDYEIPIEVAQPLFEAIAQAQKVVEEKEIEQKLEEEERKKKMEEEGEEEKELTEEEKEKQEQREAWKTVLASSETWGKLLTILDGDSIDLPSILNEGTYAHEEGRRATAYKKELKALTVDYDVLKKSFDELESQRSRLQDENDNLKKELDPRARARADSWQKASPQKGGRSPSATLDEEDLEKLAGLSSQLGDLQHHREDKERDRQKRRDNKYALDGRRSSDANESLGGPQGWLQMKGTFVGTIKTEENVLDVAVPLTGDLPLWLVLTTVQELKAGSKAALEEQEEKKILKEQERLKAKAEGEDEEGEGDEEGEEGEEKEREEPVMSPEVWAELFKFLSGGQPMDNGHHRAGMGLGLAGPAVSSEHGNQARATAPAPTNGMRQADVAAEIVSQEAAEQFQQLKQLTEVNNEVLQSIAKTEQEVLTLRREFEERMRIPKPFATMPPERVPPMTSQLDAVLHPATLPAVQHLPLVPQLPLNPYPPASDNSQPGSRTQSARGLGNFRQKKMASALSSHLQELERCASELNSLSHGNL